MYKKLFDQFLKRFFLANGREPQSPREWMSIQDDVVRFLNKTKGVPPGPKKPPFQGWKPKVIQGGKGIESLIKSGDVKKGVAPKTTKETLKTKKDRGILLRDAEEDIARIKRENKQAIEDFKEKRKYDDVTKKMWKEKSKKKDRPSIRLIKNFEKELTDIDLAQEGYNLQEIGILKRARDVMKKEGQNPDDALAWVRGEMADDAGVDFEDFMTDFDWGDFPGKAQGGRIGYAGGAIVKGGKWFLNNLRRALKDIESNQGFKNLTPERKEGLTSEIKNLIKSIEGGGPLPDEMIQTIRSDPKFANVSRTRSTDPDLYEFEDVVLNYGKKGDVVDEQVKILEEFTPTGKGNAEGGRIGMMYGGDPGFAFEYGGSWADWQDKHRDQMPVEQYIQTKLPKDRLPFREMQSGGLAYMLGEPTYMKYGVGGSVGHAPWHKPTGQQQPQQQLDTPQPQIGGAQSPGSGQPNPMKAPRGLPSLAPRTMDPAFMQQQMMQRAMMGQGQPRMGRADGGGTQEDFNRFLKEREEGHREGGRRQLEKDWERYKRFKQYGKGAVQEAAQGGRIGYDIGGYAGNGHLEPKIQGLIDAGLSRELAEFLAQYGISADIDDFAQGGRIGFGLGGINKGRRAFMKWLAGITGAGIAAGTGLLKLGKAAKVVPKVTEEVIKRGADGMPKYIYDLIEVVKAKGVRDIIEGYKKTDYSTVHSYKGVDVIEHPNGATSIKKQHEGSGTYTTDEGVDESFDGITHEIEMEISPRYREEIDPDSGVSWYTNEKGKKVYEQKIPDEYVEYTAKPDMDGKMKDVEEYIDDVDHLDLKKIADEIDTLVIKKTKKASGGVAHLLGE